MFFSNRLSFEVDQGKLSALFFVEVKTTRNGASPLMQQNRFEVRADRDKFGMTTVRKNAFTTRIRCIILALRRFNLLSVIFYPQYNPLYFIFLIVKESLYFCWQKRINFCSPKNIFLYSESFSLILP